jgi:hypothetical protein
MMSARTQLTAMIAAALLVVLSATAHAEDESVTAARELYASAAYDDALRMLDGLLNASVSPEDRRAIGLYRALCLVALGRAADADQAMETLVSQNPLYRPPTADLPPRMQSAFTDTRKRLLPGIIQRKYAEAKAAFDGDEFRAAADAFGQVLEMMGDPDIAAVAGQSPLADLRILAKGFRDLSEEELKVPLIPASPAPLVVALAPPKPARNYTRTYSAEDADVAHPGIIRQTIPPFPGKITTTSVGVIEVVINRAGIVESATIQDPIHPLYDGIAVGAAKRWQYQPATIDGVPVSFVKRVQITLTPPAAP